MSDINRKAFRARLFYRYYCVFRFYYGRIEAARKAWKASDV